MNTISLLHSGDMGDIIASLATVKEICEREHKKAVLFLDTTGGLHTNDPEIDRAVAIQSHGRGLKFDDKGYEFLKPLLEVQEYIDRVEKYQPGNAVDYNLNKFRTMFLRKDVITKTNQNLMYMHQVAFDLDMGWKGPWLSIPADMKKPPEHKLVVARSCRYQSASAFLHVNEAIIATSYFIGTDVEYSAICSELNNRNNPFHYKVENALQAAIVIDSCENCFSNGTLFYWIMVGLGKKVFHELAVDIPTTYFKDCPNVKYLQGMHFVQ